MSEQAAIVVTGAASGLGEATMRALGAQGMTVAGIDLAGAEPSRIWACDVTYGDAVDATFTEIASAFGGIAGVVNCAGIVQGGKLMSRNGPHDADVFRRVIEVNVVGTFNTMRAAASHMSENTPDEHGQRGVIVNTSSIAAYDGQIGQIAYAASKGAIASMTLPAARDLASLGIRVVSIAPGIFDTPMVANLPDDVRVALEATVPFPSKLADPADFGALVHHIFQNPTLNGEVIRLDGALRMAPR